LTHLGLDPKLSAPHVMSLPLETIGDTFVYQGARIHFKDLGKGQAIVFIHGFGSSMDTWQSLAENLGNDFHLVLMDLKGHGYSDRPRDSHYSPQDQADIVVGLMEHLKLANVVLVGHSLGSGVALLAALKDLYRPSRLVSGLVLIGATAYPEQLRLRMRWFGVPVIGWLATRLTSASFRTRMCLRGAFYDGAKVTDSLVELYARYQRLPGTSYALIRTAAQSIPPNMDSIRQEYKKLQIPVVNILGERDRVISRSSAEGLCQLLSRCTLVMVEGAGHLPHEERPEEMVHLIKKFISSL
jgi:pimeloyl-ACP methyl ester carboxylesterase